MRAKPACTRALLADLYEFTMLQSYFDCGMNDTATFELFVRRLPAHRNFMMAAGLEQALDYLANLAFDADEIEALAGMGLFGDGFLASLASLRFTGTVRAMREGTVFFADEPILQVTAPLREAQLIESRVMNLLHYETIVASKAARAGLDWGMYNYATMLALGNGVDEDRAAALAWFEKAAALGHAKSINLIGGFHEDGWVVGGAPGRAGGAHPARDAAPA